MSGYIAGIDIANMVIFLVVGFFAATNVVIAMKTKTKIGTLLAVHCGLVVIMSIMFLILQGQWSLQNFGAKFADYTNLGWSVFETINGVSLLFYNLAVKVLLGWQHTIDDIEICVNTETDKEESKQ